MLIDHFEKKETELMQLLFDFWLANFKLLLLERIQIWLVQLFYTNAFWLTCVPYQYQVFFT